MNSSTTVLNSGISRKRREFEMTKMDYLKLLVDEIHSTTVATIGSDGHPQTRIIDMMKKVCIFLQQRAKHFMTS